jgi:hypothetical protein
MLIYRYVSLSCYCYLRVQVIQIKRGKRNNSGGKRDSWATAHTIAALDEVQNKEKSIRQGSGEFSVA